ncbi:acylphosphatase [archaeon]|nr:acylphosphatase [archaeon]
MIKKRILIKGLKIHNIRYRFFLYDEASRLPLPHFDARNVRGGSKTQAVEVYAGGDTGEVERFVSFTKSNFPYLAEVSNVTEEDYKGEIRTIDAFERSFMMEQQSKFATYGLEMLNTLKSMDRKQEEHIEVSRGIARKQDEHVQITEEGFESITRELKGFKEIHEEIKELRHEVDGLKGIVARIKKKVAA